jgi:hypothetical protein
VCPKSNRPVIFWSQRKNRDSWSWLEALVFLTPALSFGYGGDDRGPDVRGGEDHCQMSSGEVEGNLLEIGSESDAQKFLQRFHVRLWVCGMFDLEVHVRTGSNGSHALLLQVCSER